MDSLVEAGVQEILADLQVRASTQPYIACVHS